CTTNDQHLRAVRKFPPRTIAAAAISQGQQTTGRAGIASFSGATGRLVRQCERGTRPQIRILHCNNALEQRTRPQQRLPSPGSRSKTAHYAESPPAVASPRGSASRSSSSEYTIVLSTLKLNRPHFCRLAV